MGFGDHAATAFSHLHRAFGDQGGVTQITWDPDGDNITCDAIMGSKNISSDNDDGADHVEMRRLIVLTADIADPQVGKEVVHGSDKYKVVEIERSGFGTASMRVVNKTPVARADAGHTKRMV